MLCWIFYTSLLNRLRRFLLVGFCVCVAEVCAIIVCIVEWYIKCYLFPTFCAFRHSHTLLHPDCINISVRCSLNVAVGCPRRDGIIPILSSLWVKSARCTRGFCTHRIVVHWQKKRMDYQWTRVRRNREPNETIFIGFPYDLFVRRSFWLCVVSLIAFEIPSSIRCCCTCWCCTFFFRSFFLFFIYLYSLFESFLFAICVWVRVRVCVCLSAYLMPAANRAL